MHISHHTNFMHQDEHLIHNVNLMHRAAHLIAETQTSCTGKQTSHTEMQRCIYTKIQILLGSSRHWHPILAHFTQHSSKISDQNHQTLFSVSNLINTAHFLELKINSNFWAQIFNLNLKLPLSNPLPTCHSGLLHFHQSRVHHNNITLSLIKSIDMYTVVLSLLWHLLMIPGLSFISSRVAYIPCILKWYNTLVDISSSNHPSKTWKYHHRASHYWCVSLKYPRVSLSLSFSSTHLEYI